MSLPRLDNPTKIADRLNLLAAIVKTRSRAGLTDGNHILESISARFFNVLFDWKLENLNAELANFPAADLGDRQKRVAIQVTNAEGSDKITHTTSKAVEHELGKEFDRLIIFFLLAKKPRLPRDFTQPNHGPRIEMWDITDLLRQLQDFEDLNRLALAAKVLDEEMGRVQAHVHRPTSNASRILRCARSVITASVLSVLLIAIIFNQFFRRPSSDSFRILVAEIDGPDLGLTGTFIEKLRQETRDYRDIAIHPLKRKISVQDGSSLAAELLKQEKADLLIWGRNPDSSDYITLYFELEKPELRTVASSDGVTQLIPDGRTGSYVFQQKLGSEISAFALLIVAYAKLQQRNYTQALGLFDRIIAGGSTSTGFFERAEVLLARADCYEALGSNCTVLIHEISTAIASNANHANVYIARAGSFLKCRELDECITDCDIALQLAPGHGLALSTKANAFARKGDFVTALLYVEQAITNDPSYDGYHLLKADLLAKAGNKKDAIEECSKVLNRNKRLKVAYAIRGSAYSDSGDYKKAIADLTQAIAATDVPESKSSILVDRGIAHVRLGISRNNTKDILRGVSDYTEAVRIAPKNPWAYRNRGVIYVRFVKPELAIEDLTKTLDLNTNDCEAYRMRGDVFWSLQNYKRADEDFAAATHCNTNYADAFERRGMLASERKDVVNAISYLSSAIRLNPNATNAFRVRAAAYLACGRLNSAVADFARIVSLDPDDSLAKHLANELALVASQREGAMIGFEWAVASSRDHVTTNHGSGFLVQGDKALYLVSAATAVDRMNSNVVVEIRGASNRLSRISLKSLSKDNEFSQGTPVWLTSTGIDCAVCPVLPGFRSNQLPTELLRNITTVPFRSLKNIAFVPRIGSSAIALGLSAGNRSSGDFSLDEKVVTISGGISTNSNGARRIILQEALSNEFAGQPVFDPTSLSIDIQSNSVSQTLSSPFMPWGLVSVVETDSNHPNTVSVVDISHVFELIAGFESRFTLITNSPRPDPK